MSSYYVRIEKRGRRTRVLRFVLLLDAVRDFDMSSKAMSKLLVQAERQMIFFSSSFCLSVPLVNDDQVTTALLFSRMSTAMFRCSKTGKNGNDRSIRKEFGTDFSFTSSQLEQISRHSIIASRAGLRLRSLL